MPKPIASEPSWISLELTLAIHKRQLAEHGGIEGVRDEGLLSSALAHPKHLLAYSKETPDVASFAAAYGFGIARNPPFLDGNRRTAYVERSEWEHDSLRVISHSENKTNHE